MSKYKICTALLLAAYGVWRFIMPAMNLHPDQDECSFGPVSNAQYRAILNRARQKTREDWPTLFWVPVRRRSAANGRIVRAEDEQADRLKKRIADINKNASTLPERIAGIHAVMRATGANFYNLPSNRFNAWSNYQLRIENDSADDKKLWGYAPQFKYVIDSNRFGVLSLTERYSQIQIYYQYSGMRSSAPSYITSVPKGDEFYVVVKYGSLLGKLFRIDRGWIEYDANARHATCPPFPMQHG